MQKDHTKRIKERKTTEMRQLLPKCEPSQQKELKINHEIKLKKRKEKEMIGRTVHVCYEKNETFN